MPESLLPQPRVPVQAGDSSVAETDCAMATYLSFRPCGGSARPRSARLALVRIGTAKTRTLAAIWPTLFVDPETVNFVGAWTANVIPSGPRSPPGGCPNANSRLEPRLHLCSLNLHLGGVPLRRQ